MLEVVLLLYTDIVGGLVGHFVALKFIFWYKIGTIPVVEITRLGQKPGWDSVNPA